jgi:hypothetical protein
MVPFLGRRLLVVLLIFCVLFSSTAPALAMPGAGPLPQSGSVTPASIDLTLAPDNGFTQEIKVQTAKTPVPKLDVLLVFDVTGSMGGVINSAKANGTGIMNDVRSRVPDTAFGVGSFSDYPFPPYGIAGDYPWKLDQPVTNDVNAVQKEINSLSLHNGEDTPEDYSRVLFETMLVNWRPGSKRVVVLFGDAPAHDTSFYAKNLGADPGVDGVVGTADDIIFTDIVAKVAGYPIIFFPINSNLSGDADVQKGFAYIADKTHGRVFSLNKIDEVPDAVQAGLTEASNLIRQLTLVASPDTPAWVNIGTKVHENVEGGQTRSFDVDIHPTLLTPPGEYKFTLTVSGDGGTLGVIPVRVMVSGKKLAALDLMQQKRSLITALTDLKANVDIFSITIPFQPGVNYGDQEKAVEAYLNTLNPASMKPAEVGSLSQLVSLEDGFKRLWEGQVKTSFIVGKHISNAVMVAMSMTDLLDYLDRPDIVNKISGFFTKMIKEIKKKVVDVTMDFIAAMVSELPNKDSPQMQIFKGAIEGINSLAQVALDKNPGASIKDIIGKGVVPLAFTAGMSNGYIGNSGKAITDGLAEAKKLAGRDISLDQASSEAAIAENKVNAAVTQAIGSIGDVQRESEEAEKTQNTLKIASDLADIAAVATSMTPFNQVTQGLAMLVKFFDIGISMVCINDAGEIWGNIYTTAPLVSKSAFPSLVSLGAPTVQMVVFKRSVDANSGSPAADVMAFAAPLSTRISAAGDDVKGILNQLVTAVQGRDTDQVVALGSQLLDQDATFEDALRAGQAPVLQASSNPTLRADTIFRAQYSGMVSATSTYNLGAASLYTRILAFLYDPADTQARTALLDEIASLLKIVDGAVTGTDTILPKVQPYVSQPIAAIAHIDYPEDISTGRAVELSVLLSNPIPIDATGVVVKLTPQKGIQLVSATEVRVDNLVGGGTAEVKFQIIVQENTSSGLVETTSANGTGQSRGFSLDLNASSNGGGGGLAIVLILGVVAGSGVWYASMKRRKALKGTSVKAAARLVGTAGECNGQQIAISRNNWVIGRGAGSDLRLTDAAVSRRHALLCYAQGAWFIQDQGSSGGTLVNGERIQALRLRSGDQITIDGSTFLFLEG